MDKDEENVEECRKDKVRGVLIDRIKNFEDNN